VAHRNAGGVKVATAHIMKQIVLATKLIEKIKHPRFRASRERKHIINIGWTLISTCRENKQNNTKQEGYYIKG